MRFYVVLLTVCLSVANRIDFYFGKYFTPFQMQSLAIVLHTKDHCRRRRSIELKVPIRETMMFVLKFNLIVAVAAALLAVSSN